MNSGGHSGYFDCYPDTDPQELINAIIAVSYKEIANNYQKAFSEGENDGYEEREYVERNKDVIFD